MLVKFLDIKARFKATRSRVIHFNKSSNNSCV